MYIMKCKHPDHTNQITCIERGVGCSKLCICCMGKSYIERKIKIERKVTVPQEFTIELTTPPKDGDLFYNTKGIGVKSFDEAFLIYKICHELFTIDHSNDQSHRIIKEFLIKNKKLFVNIPKIFGDISDYDFVLKLHSLLLNCSLFDNSGLIFNIKVLYHNIDIYSENYTKVFSDYNKDE